MLASGVHSHRYPSVSNNQQLPLCQVYEGGWLDGQRSGAGSLRLPGGDVFEGHWLLDKKEGPGEKYEKETQEAWGPPSAASLCSCKPTCASFPPCCSVAAYVETSASS